MKTKKKPSKNTTFYFCGKKKRKNNYSEQVISLCKKEIIFALLFAAVHCFVAVHAADVARPLKRSRRVRT
jgi:hypothetical protein